MEYVDFNEIKSESGENAPKGSILCCQCGLAIEPNPANMCVGCIRTHIDITADIPKQATLHFCRSCERYLHPPSEWVHCVLESKELMAICLKKLRGLKDVKLEESRFEWTEPHSKRLKIRLTVRKEVLGGTLLEQVFVVEFTINYLMCDDCHRTEAKNYWTCLVQVRQHAENKKTFYYLEQLMLKHRAHENALGIRPVSGGLDFYYANENYARKMVDFLQTMLPVKCTESKRLISHDIHSNTYNCKFTYAVDIAPLSKDSLVCLKKQLAHQLGSISQICLVARVANTIHLIDPRTAQLAELSANVFYRQPFGAIFNPKHLTEYIVMDIEVIRNRDLHCFPGQGKISRKHVVSDVWLVKAAELGINENTIHTKTHLGHILKPGDSVMGYNLLDSNINDVNFDKLDKSKVPDVVIVKKHYGDSTGRRNNRNWKLKHLPEEETNLDKSHKDYNEFLEDLEEDPQFRKNVDIFRATREQIPVDTNDMDDPSVPRITLEEMPTLGQLV
ncbi:60S ribosomal export protein NMD3, partial [Pseudolycoriella hygida]